MNAESVCEAVILDNPPACESREREPRSNSQFSLDARTFL